MLLRKLSSRIVWLLLLVMALVSCKENKKRTEAEQIVAEWMGKEIHFPVDYQCSFSGKDTTLSLCSNLFQAEYKILLYVDSTGCTDCKLRMFEWADLMDEAESLYKDKLSFLFFFQPNNKKDFEFYLVRDQLNYPVFFDFEAKINEINHFSEQAQYQCFLLDKNNKVMMIGNPFKNPKIWELYKEQISGNKTAEQQKLTSIEIVKPVYDFGNIRIGESSQAVFQLKNTGDYPLIINHVSTSCGCTAVDWEKRPIEPGKTAAIKVEIKPEEAGFFDKTITVYCNVKESQVNLTITGTANK